MTAPDDDRLLRLLAAALEQTDPVPEAVTRVAVGALSWRTIEADLAALVYDSGMEGSGARGDEVTRQLTFGAAGLEIEVMVVPAGGRRLVGQLVPAQAATVSLTCGDLVVETASDQLGRFRFEQVAEGPFRITVAPGFEGRPVETEWIVL